MLKDNPFILFCVLAMGAFVAAAESPITFENTVCAWKIAMVGEDDPPSPVYFAVADNALVEQCLHLLPPGDYAGVLFAFNTANNFDWPCTSTGEVFHRGQAQSIPAGREYRFILSWKLAVYVVPGEGGPSSHLCELSLAEGAMPVASRLTVVRDRDGMLVGTRRPGDAAETLRFSTDGASGKDGGGYQPVYYTITLECAASDQASQRYALSPGWNLVGIPFLKVTDDGGLFDAGQVLTADTPWRAVAGKDALDSGGAYWVFIPGAEGAEITLKGIAGTGDAPHFRPDAGSRWMAASLVGQWDEAGKKWQEPSADAAARWQWDAEAQSMAPSAGVPAIGVGYYRRQRGVL